MGCKHDGSPGVDLGVLRRIGIDAGLTAVGVTTADVLEPARSVLPQRRDAGRSATMAFTYRNPARSTDPALVLDGARSILVGVLDYHRPEPAPIAEGPIGRVARYAWEDFYGQLGNALGAMAVELERAGYRARVVADSNALVDRNAAWRAGIGWYGKNSNLLVPGAGSWFVLGAVVTDAEIGPEPVPVPDGCGPCSVCLDACPTQALVAPGVLDARRCIAWLVQAGEPIPVELRASVGDWLYGCDICQDVCPPNRVTIRRRAAPPPGPGARSGIDLRWVLTVGDDELLAECGQWYIADRDPDVIRRTALVVLGNVGRRHDADLVPILRRYLASSRGLLRAHAVWAARRLGLGHLAAATVVDVDPLVRDEWRHRVEVAGPGARGPD